MAEKIIIRDHAGNEMEFPKRKIKKIPQEEMIGMDHRERIIDLGPMTNNEMLTNLSPDDLRKGKIPQEEDPE